MSSTVLTAPAQYSLLLAALPGNNSLTIGVLLEDPAADRTHVRLRRDWDALVDAGTLEEDDAEIFEVLEDDLKAKSLEYGASRFFAWIEDSLSNVIRVSDREPVLVEDYDRALIRLYRQHIDPKVLPFRTHLPRYSLQAAAGKFLENREIVEEGWEETPSDIRLSEDLFVAHIRGRSMEPRIPDGSLCIFRYGVTGSRQGRLVLVENLREGSGNRYTVKRYRSEKVAAEDGTWSQARIRLEPLNQEFEAWDIDPSDGQVRVIAEFVRVLDTSA